MVYWCCARLAQHTADYLEEGGTVCLEQWAADMLLVAAVVEVVTAVAVAAVIATVDVGLDPMPCADIDP